MKGIYEFFKQAVVGDAMDFVLAVSVLFGVVAWGYVLWLASQ